MSKNRTTFRLTEDHLKLLRRMNIGWNLCEYGSPSVDPKRPYGNSDVTGDICEILGWEPADRLDGWSCEQRERAAKLHWDMDLALSVVFATAQVPPGEYRLADPYDYRSWKLASQD